MAGFAGPMFSLWLSENLSKNTNERQVNLTIEIYSRLKMEDMHRSGVVY
jgi:hypothetical protein